MGKDFPFTIGFIEQHPRSSARALASLDHADVAAFLDTIPAKLAATVLSQMNAGPAAAVLKRMDASAGAAILAEMNHHDAVSIVRLFDGKSLTSLLDRLPAKLRRDLKTTLSFPPDTVGAKMNTKIVMMTGDQTAGEALVELRKMRRTRTSTVFVVDASKRLIGVVTTADLLQGRAERRLSDTMDTQIMPLSARARLETVASLAAWDDYAQLPVLNAQRRLIGSLSRKAAWRASLPAPVTDDIASPSIVASIANAFVASFVGLAQLMADVERPPGRDAGGEP